MQRFKNILVVIDSRTADRAVCERAGTLAQNNQARLTVVTIVETLPPDTAMPATTQASGDIPPPLLDVIEELPPDGSESSPPEPPVAVERQVNTLEETPFSITPKAHFDIHEHINEDCEPRLEQAIEAIRQQGIEVNAKVLFGTPFLEIIREVVCNQHDLVMIAAEDQGGLREKLFGSTTMQLMRKCPCPVWVIKPTQPQANRRIMAAVDPDPLDQTRNALNIQIMQLATSLAHQEQSELLIVHAWTAYGEARLRGGFIRASDREVDKYVQETRREHLRHLAALLEKQPLADLKHQIYMLKGQAGHLLPELAKRKAVDLMVMGTVCRTGVGGFLMGNTAENVLQQVNCSVLAIKPEGFITPVKLENW